MLEVTGWPERARRTRGPDAGSKLEGSGPVVIVIVIILLFIIHDAHTYYYVIVEF